MKQGLMEKVARRFGWGRPTVRAGILANSGLSQKLEKNRIRLLCRALEEAGVEEVFLCGVSQEARADFGHASHQDLSALFQECGSNLLLVCPSSQYHVTSQHIRKIVETAVESGKNTSFNHEGCRYLGNMGLNFALAALFPARCSQQDFHPEYLNFWNETGPFKAENGSVNSLEISQEDIQSAYRVFTETSLPSTYTVELNSSCNFRCGYCPFHGDDEANPLFVRADQGREMALEDFERIVKDIAAWEDDYAATQKTIAPFWRGEFFLSKNWESALRIIRENGLRSYVCTNASVLSEEIVDKIFENNYLDQLSISLEATTHEMNLRVRKNTKYSTIVKNIERLLEKRDALRSSLRVALNFTLIEENKGVVEEFVKKWGKKVDYILMGPWNRLNTQTGHGDFEKNLMFFDVNKIRRKRVPCVYLYNSIGIDCDQNLHLCTPCGSTRVNIGNLKNQTLRGARENSDLFQKVQAMHRDGTYMNHDYCRNCTMWEFHFSVEEEKFGFRNMVTPYNWSVLPG